MHVHEPSVTARFESLKGKTPNPCSLMTEGSWTIARFGVLQSLESIKREDSKSCNACEPSTNLQSLESIKREDSKSCIGSMHVHEPSVIREH